MSKSLLLFTLAGVIALPMSAMAAANVTENEDSATGYTVNFEYQNPNATNVQIVGGFEFAEENYEKAYSGGLFLDASEQENFYVEPEDWTSGSNLWHVSDSGCVREMTQENGTWSISMDLTGGYYLYQFNVSYDNGENWQTLTDPDNVPACNAIGCSETRSQVYVPYNAEKQNPQDDVAYQAPAENEENRGTELHLTYAGVDDIEMPMEVYLPAHYDKDREEPYKVLYLSHGGLGEEGDWLYQGHAGNILDNLAADGTSEEFILVLMNNDILQGEFMPGFGVNDWNYDKIYENLTGYLIPYMEEHYNISGETKDRAYAGLSMGSWTTCEIFYRDPALFGYYGIFSGGAPLSFPETADYSNYQEPSLYLAAGWSDIALGVFYQTDSDHTLLSFKEKLEAAGISYNNGGEYYSVQGGHDWYTWPQILKDYFENYLWK